MPESGKNGINQGHFEPREIEKLTPVPDTSGLASITQVVEVIVDMAEQMPRDLHSRS
jgi:hypothetical protein